MATEKKPVFLMKILYKSGNSHTFPCHAFSLKNDIYEWTPLTVHNKPVFIGAGNIEAVWQVGAWEDISDVPEGIL